MKPGPSLSESAALLAPDEPDDDDDELGGAAKLGDIMLAAV